VIPFLSIFAQEHIWGFKWVWWRKFVAVAEHWFSIKASELNSIQVGSLG
jgi:hypothetical protein